MSDEPVRLGILTISDGVAAGRRTDVSGEHISNWGSEQGFEIAAQAVVPDEPLEIVRVLLGWVDEREVDLVLTTGGTGFTARDVTPEATAAVVDRSAPGIVERIRAAGFEKTPFADLGRGIAGIRGGTLIVNLPGSPAGVRDGLEVLSPIARHAAELLRGEGCHDPTRADG